MNDHDKLLLISILEKFELGKNIQSDEISNISKFKSGSYALADVWSFVYQDCRYYVSNDYSLDDNYEYIRNVFEEINHLLKGQLLKNPRSKSSESYSVNVGNNEYYLWQSTNY